MVYYVDDVVNEGWTVVVHIKPRDLYDMGEEVEENDMKMSHTKSNNLNNFLGLMINMYNWRQTI